MRFYNNKLRCICLISSFAFIFCVTGCKDKKSTEGYYDSSTGLYMLPTLDISTDLEISPFQEYDLGMSAETPTNLFDHYYVYDGVSLTPDRTEYSMDDMKLELTLHNKTEGEVGGDFFFQLEVLIDGCWYVIPPVNYSFIEIAAVFPIGSYTRPVDLSEVDVNYIEGKYRIIKEYGMEGLRGKIIAYAEFELYE